MDSWCNIYVASDYCCWYWPLYQQLYLFISGVLYVFLFFLGGWRGVCSCSGVAIPMSALAPGVTMIYDRSRSLPILPEVKDTVRALHYHWPEWEHTISLIPRIVITFSNRFWHVCVCFLAGFKLLEMFNHFTDFQIIHRSLLRTQASYRRWSNSWF